MTGPRYALNQKVRIEMRAATVRGITYGRPILYDLHLGPVTEPEIMPYVAEDRIKPLVANDGGENE